MKTPSNIRGIKCVWKEGRRKVEAVIGLFYEQTVGITRQPWWVNVVVVRKNAYLRQAVGGQWVGQTGRQAWAGWWDGGGGADRQTWPLVWWSGWRLAAGGGWWRVGSARQGRRLGRAAGAAGMADGRGSHHLPSLPSSCSDGGLAGGCSACYPPYLSPPPYPVTPTCPRLEAHCLSYYHSTYYHTTPPHSLLPPLPLSLSSLSLCTLPSCLSLSMPFPSPLSSLLLLSRTGWNRHLETGGREWAGTKGGGTGHGWDRAWKKNRQGRHGDRLGR